MTNGPTLLGSATARYVYDVTQMPLRVGTILREEHYAITHTTRYQMSFAYSDGLGRPLMQKVMADDGDALYVDRAGNLQTATAVTRWVGTGKTILNNKSKPIKQYEPYFSTTHLYENDVALTEIGHSPEIYYDAAGRVVKTKFPNGTFAHTVYDAWGQTVYDANDNVEDSDWKTERTTGSLSSVPEEVDAYNKASVHDNTPNRVFIDCLGRTFCSILHNKVPVTGGPMQDEWLVTGTTYDIEGNVKTMTDALGRTQLTYKFDMLGNSVYQNSFDTGESFQAYDVYGKPIVNWDTTLRKTTHLYDARQRVTDVIIDDGTSTNLVMHLEYGDGIGTRDNLVGKVYQVYDGSGMKENTMYDFKGNVLSSRQQLLDDKTLTDVDWASSPVLSSETFYREMTYDALNRLVNETDPLGNIREYFYDKGGRLYRMRIKDSTATAKDYIGNIFYDAKGRRKQISFSNGTATSYTYDEKTNLVRRIQTNDNSSNKYQDLNYYYDPVGNITKVRDDAQQTLYYSGTMATPVMDYTYDPLYRLTKAQGREKIQAATYGSDDNYDDAPWMGVSIGAAASGVQTYTQEFTYDKANNIKQLKHTASTSGSYTRNYSYNSTNNQLNSTTVGSTTYNYGYDDYGNMDTMPHLSSIIFNNLNQFSGHTRGTTITNYQYDGSGMRVRKFIEKSGPAYEERI